MKNTQLVHFSIDTPSFGLIEKYCQRIEIPVTKFFRDATRLLLINMVNEGRIKNDTDIHVNQLVPKLTPGRPRKVKLEEDAA